MSRNKGWKKFEMEQLFLEEKDQKKEYEIMESHYLQEIETLTKWENEQNFDDYGYYDEYNEDIDDSEDEMEIPMRCDHRNKICSCGLMDLIIEEIEMGFLHYDFF